MTDLEHILGPAIIAGINRQIQSIYYKRIGIVEQIFNENCKTHKNWTEKAV